MVRWPWSPVVLAVSRGPDAPFANGSLKGSELSDLLRGLQGVRRGDFSVRLPAGWPGLMGEVADCFNESSP